VPERASEFLTPDVKWQGAQGTVEGVENLMGLLHGFMAAFPDLHATEPAILAEDDLVGVRLSVETTHQEDLFGIPATGRPVRWDAIDVFRLVDGKITEEWAADDALARESAPRHHRGQR